MRWRRQNGSNLVPFSELNIGLLLSWGSGAECEHDHHRLLDARDDWLRPPQEGQGGMRPRITLHYI